MENTTEWLEVLLDEIRMHTGDWNPSLRNGRSTHCTLIGSFAEERRKHTLHNDWKLCWGEVVARTAQWLEAFLDGRKITRGEEEALTARWLEDLIEVRKKHTLLRDWKLCLRSVGCTHCAVTGSFTRWEDKARKAQWLEAFPEERRKHTAQRLVAMLEERKQLTLNSDWKLCLWIGGSSHCTVTGRFAWGEEEAHTAQWWVDLLEERKQLTLLSDW